MQMYTGGTSAWVAMPTHVACSHLEQHSLQLFVSLWTRFWLRFHACSTVFEIEWEGSLPLDHKIPIRRGGIANAPSAAVAAVAAVTAAVGAGSQVRVGDGGGRGVEDAVVGIAGRGEGRRGVEIGHVVGGSWSREIADARVWPRPVFQHCAQGFLCIAAVVIQDCVVTVCRWRIRIGGWEATSSL